MDSKGHDYSGGSYCLRCGCYINSVDADNACGRKHRFEEDASSTSNFDVAGFTAQAIAMDFSPSYEPPAMDSFASDAFSGGDSGGGGAGADF